MTLLLFLYCLRFLSCLRVIWGAMHRSRTIVTNQSHIHIYGDMGGFLVSHHRRPTVTYTAKLMVVQTIDIIGWMLY